MFRYYSLVIITINLLVFLHTGNADPLTTCGCDTTVSAEKWSTVSTSPSSPLPISSVAQPTQCWQFTKTSGTTTCDGLCVILGDCSNTSTPTFYIENERIKVASPPAQSGWCLDQNTAELYIQVYPNCISGDTHQNWMVNTTTQQIQELWTGENLCMGIPPAYNPQTCPIPPPPPGAEFCYQYHPIHAANIYDPSGPFLNPFGVWHVWEDMQGWGHYWSTDLLRWNLLGNPTGFGGLTGSIGITPSGLYAFWPEGDQSGVDMAISTDTVNFTTWNTQGRVITKPAMAGSNFRDPLRAFQYENNWYVGVGCNNNSQSADLCLFQASDSTLNNFTYIGPMYSTNITYGQMNTDIVWVNTSVQAIMMECPDIYALETKYMLIGSLYTTNQWWIGTVSGNPPQFYPENVGIMDYGNGYAAKTGSTYAADPNDRRVVFGFTGWNEPTADSVCGRALIIPRDITLGSDGISPRINPIPELNSLKNMSSLTSITSPVENGALQTGSQMFISMECTYSSYPSVGNIYTRVLGSASGTSSNDYTEVGYDFSTNSLYVDHSNCCANSNSIIQRAPLITPISQLNGLINITILVDGGLIESFLNGLVTITALINPDVNAGNPNDRTNVFTNNATGLQCTTNAWQLYSISSAQQRGSKKETVWYSKLNEQKQSKKQMINAVPKSFLLHPGPIQPASLYISPLNYSHTLIGPAYNSQNPTPPNGYYYATQWSNPNPLVNSTVQINSPGPCSLATSHESVDWFIDNGAIRICAIINDQNQNIIYELGANGNGGNISNPVSCGEEFDAFLAPNDKAYNNIPINLLEPGKGAPNIGNMSSLIVQYDAKLLEWNIISRCGPLGSCGPSGKLDYAYAVLGIVISNEITDQTLFYQIILADTRASSPNCKNNDPCVTPFSYWFFDTLPTLGVSDSTLVMNLPCLQPEGQNFTNYNIPIFDRIITLLNEGASKYGSDPLLYHWYITGLYIGIGLEGSAQAGIQIQNIDLLYT